MKGENKSILGWYLASFFSFQVFVSDLWHRLNGFSLPKCIGKFCLCSYVDLFHFFLVVLSDLSLSLCLIFRSFFVGSCGGKLLVYNYDIDMLTSSLLKGTPVDVQLPTKCREPSTHVNTEGLCLSLFETLHLAIHGAQAISTWGAKCSAHGRNMCRVAPLPQTALWKTCDETWMSDLGRPLHVVLVVATVSSFPTTMM